MAESQKLTPDQARTIAEQLRLDLPPERLELFVKAYPDFIAKFEEMRTIDKGDREPPTITWERES